MDIPEGLYQRLLKAPEVVIDSRQATEGSLFFGLRGHQVDGNAYASDARERGAAAVVVDQPQVMPEEPTEAAAYFLVPDVLVTLQALATYHRQRLQTSVLAIGGSNGKTTTKELIIAVLQQRLSVHATKGNLNNHIGLPLTLLHLQNKHELAVLEFGANQPGEYTALCQIAEPDMGLITNIGMDHLEGYGNFQGVVEAHRELTTYLRNKEGLLFLNADDPEIRGLTEGVATVSYGTADATAAYQPDYQGTITKRVPALELMVTKAETGVDLHIATQLYGGYNFANVMAAFGVGHYFGLTTTQVKMGIEAYQPSSNRSQQIAYGGGRVILDAYNANPSSMVTALSDFEALARECRVAIIGDMYELGRHTDAEHQRILAFAQSCTFSAVFVGAYFFRHRQQFTGLFFQGPKQLEAWWQEQDLTDCWILLKGSRAMALESLIA